MYWGLVKSISATMSPVLILGMVALFYLSLGAGLILSYK